MLSKKITLKAIIHMSKQASIVRIMRPFYGSTRSRHIIRHNITTLQQLVHAYVYIIATVNTIYLTRYNIKLMIHYCTPPGGHIIHYNTPPGGHIHYQTYTWAALTWD